MLNQRNSHIDRTILRNTFRAFTSARVFVYRSAHACPRPRVTHTANRHASNMRSLSAGLSATVPAVAQ
jgi:hypothetical protein